MHWSMVYRIRQTMDLATWRATRPRGALTVLAEKTGIRWQTLYDIARGKQRPRVDTAKAIAEATDGAVSVHELLGIEPASEPTTPEAA